MKTMFKSMTALMLAVVMSLSLLCGSVWAVDAEVEAESPLGVMDVLEQKQKITLSCAGVKDVYDGRRWEVSLKSSTKSQSFNIGAKALGGAKLTYKVGDHTESYECRASEYVKVDAKGNVSISKNFWGIFFVRIRAEETDEYNGGSAILHVLVAPPSVSLSSVSNASGKKLTVKWKSVASVDSVSKAMTAVDKEADEDEDLSGEMRYSAMLKVKNVNLISGYDDGGFGAYLSGEVGYEIQYSTDKSFKKDVKTVKVKNQKKAVTSKTISGLTKNKTYYVRMRTYWKLQDYQKHSASSKWSAVKSVKIKK